MLAQLSGGRMLAFTYVDVEFDLNPGGTPTNDTVAVKLRPLHLSLPLDDVGGMILPMARGVAEQAAFLQARTPLLPTGVTFAHDRVLGTTIGGRWQLAFGTGEAENDNQTPIHFRAAASKAIDTSFYFADSDIRLARQRTSGLIRQLSAGFDGATSLEPRGVERYRSRNWGAVGGVELALKANTRLMMDARFGRTEHTFSETESTRRWSASNEQANRILFDTIPPRLLGFFRAAVWQDNLQPRNAARSHRVVGRLGYAREIPIGPNQSIGIELLAGGGQTWRNIEEPRRFFAGGAQGEFLYENSHSRALLSTPDGPLLRSLGRAQGGWRDADRSVRGGTHFWHVNVNIALPIPRWSRPLIPNETTDLPGADGSPQTLKQILRAQVDRTGPNMLQSTLQLRDGLTADEAKQRAGEIFAGVRPAAHFVIDQANLIAIKPLLMLDVAELNFSPGSESWTAAGVGVQVTIVTAKFEAGYMRTLSGPTFGSRGNVFARLGFERLF
jgi:hypothetical protein